VRMTAIVFITVFTFIIVGAIAVPYLQEGCHAATETAAVTTLRQYVSAQGAYHRTDYDNDGLMEYAADLTALYDWDGPEGAEPIKLVDLATAFAHYARPELGGTSGYNGSFKPRSYYYFAELLGIVEGNKVKLFQTPQGDKGTRGWSDGFGLVAFPAVYKERQRKCFVIGPDGTVYESDIKGLDLEHTAELPWYFPDVKASGSRWRMVGE